MNVIWKFDIDWRSQYPQQCSTECADCKRGKPETVRPVGAVALQNLMKPIGAGAKIRIVSR